MTLFSYFRPAYGFDSIFDKHRVDSLSNKQVHVPRHSLDTKYNSFGKLFSLPMDNNAERISRDIFRYLDKNSFLKLCQVSKRLFEFLTDFKYVVEPKYESLFDNQRDRFTGIRAKLKADSRIRVYDILIFEGSYSYVDMDSSPKRTIKWTFDIVDKEALPELILVSTDGKESIIQISDDCKKSIKENVNGMRTSKEYDCVQFALECLGQKKEIRSLNVNKEFFFKNDLVAGDLVAFYKGPKFKHVAVYLENGIYISKYGQYLLYCSHSKDLKECYGANNVYRAFPQLPESQTSSL